MPSTSRCGSVVGVFPNPKALLRLAGAVLVETHDEWAVTDRRYLSENCMKAITITITTQEVATPAELTALGSTGLGSPQMLHSLGKS